MEYLDITYMGVAMVWFWASVVILIVPNLVLFLVVAFFGRMFVRAFKQITGMAL